MLATINTTCPRCGLDVEQRFHGPCAACRSALQELTPPAPDPLHFPAGKRMDGTHIIDVKTCNDDSCSRVACEQARS